MAGLVCQPSRQTSDVISEVCACLQRRLPPRWVSPVAVGPQRQHPSRSSRLGWAPSLGLRQQRLLEGSPSEETFQEVLLVRILCAGVPHQAALLGVVSISAVALKQSERLCWLKVGCGLCLKDTE